jgi:thiaminase
MKHVLAVSALLISLYLPAVAGAQTQYPGAYGQPHGWHGVLSAADQSQFDNYYQRWVDATRKNDQDEVSNSARHMQEIMTRYNIPSNVPFDQVSSMGAAGAYSSGAYPAGAQGSNPAYGSWAGRLSSDDQKNFDKYYSKWVDARRKNDQDDISNNARKMQEIMARYNIPANIPFDQIATNGNAGAYPPSAYPAGQPYAVSGPRLSTEDQKQFDKAYQKWIDATRKNDRDDIDENAKKMQVIMGRYNIPSNVPFAQVASGGYATNPNAAGYPNAGYPNAAYGYPAGQRLSAEDQKNFDKYYKKWVDARRKKDREDIDENAKKMQNIMARYNIPANVPFDQIASADAANR